MPLPVHVATYLYFVTFMPAASATAGLSPTALRFSPVCVLNNTWLVIIAIKTLVNPISNNQLVFQQSRHSHYKPCEQQVASVDQSKSYMCKHLYLKLATSFIYVYSLKKSTRQVDFFCLFLISITKYYIYHKKYICKKRLLL